LESILVEDFVLLGIIAILGTVLQMDFIKRWRYNWALQIIRLAVAWTYNEYIRVNKKDGKKLTDDQRAAARMIAVKKAKEMAKQKGIDIEGILGNELIEMFVEVAVANAKKGKDHESS